MAFAPVSFIANQYEDFENWWLKCYQQGTTTPITMYNDSAGTTAFAKLEINVDGFFNSTGGDIINPHVGETYDAWIFPTEAEANANDTANAKQIADNITAVDSESVATTTQNELTTDTMKNNDSYSSSDIGKLVIQTKEFSTGNGGGAIYDVVLTSSVTPNGYDIIQGVADTSISFELRKAEKTAFVRQWGAVLDGATDDRPAIQAATDYIISKNGGDVIIDGDARLVGVPTSDSLDNGIVVPFASFAQDKEVRLIGGARGGRLRAGSNDMVLLRASNVGTQAINLGFEGAGNTGVWAMGCVPEDMDQTTTQVSQSHCKMIRCQVKNCEEGFVMMPGPTVGGSDSGAFYPILYGNDFNLTNRQIWLRGCSAAAIAVGGSDGAAAAQNRVTRANVSMNTLLRGNVGLDMEYCTECTFMGNYFEFFDVARGGTSPHATPSAIFIGANSENNYIIGGHEEACDFGIDNQATAQNNMIYGFTLSGINNNVGLMPQLVPNRLMLSEAISPQAVDVTFKNDTFCKIEADPTASSVKELVVETNGAQRFRWFNGVTRHIGSSGNIEMNALGNELHGTGSNFGVNATGGFLNLIASSTEVGLYVAGTKNAAVDDDATAGNTRFLIYDVDNGTLERVSVGAADSGGAGFKVLRIPN